MRKLKETLEGKKFGKLTVISFSEIINGSSRFKCLCECGKEKIVKSNSLLTGNTKSCGCEIIKKITSHGRAGTKIHLVWMNIKSRCRNKNLPNYGGRGISYCKSWEKFENFLADMGEIPDGSFDIDRIDVNGNYCKENCRWVDRSTNIANTRRKNKLGIKGVTKVSKNIYRTNITIKGKQHVLGYFKCPLLAFTAFQNKHKEIYGF